MSSAPFDPPVATRDDQLARLLAEMTEGAHHGKVPDVEAIAQEHPELGEELRELWLTAQVADELSRAMEIDATVDYTPATAAAAGEPAACGFGHRRIGDCELLEELGRGGMGVVYRAQATWPCADRGAQDPARPVGCRERLTWLGSAPRRARRRSSIIRTLSRCMRWEITTDSRTSS